MDNSAEFRGRSWGGMPELTPHLPGYREPEPLPEAEPERVLTPAELQEMLGQDNPEAVELSASNSDGWTIPEFTDDEEDDDEPTPHASVHESKLATDGLHAATDETSEPTHEHTPQPEPSEPVEPTAPTVDEVKAPSTEIAEPMLIKPVVEIRDNNLELQPESEPDVVMVNAHEIPLDARMAMSQQMVVAAESAQTRDAAEYHALAGHVERLSDLNKTDPLPGGLAAVGRKIYIIDNGLPGVPSMPDEMLSQWAKVLKMDIMAPDGILSSLDTDQLAELFASAANHEDPRAALLSKDLMYSVIETLEEFNDPRTGEKRSGAVTLYEVRDAIRVLRRARQMPLSGVFEAPTIDAEAAAALHDSFPLSNHESIATYFEMLRALITEVVGRGTPDEYRVNEVPLSKRRDLAARHDDEQNRPAPGGVTVISTRMNAKGKLGHWVQTMIAVSAGAAVIANAPKSTGLYVVRNLSKTSDLPGNQHALAAARSRHIPTLVTTEFTEQVMPVIASSKFTIGKLPGQQAELVAPHTGIRTRVDLTGKSTGTSGTTGSGGHSSNSDNFRDIPAVGGRMEPNKESTGKSLTNDASYNHAVNDGKSASVGPGANIRSDESAQLHPGEVAIVDEGGTHAYNVRTTEFTRTFPPKADDEPFGTAEEAKIARVEARVKADLRVSESGRVVGLQPPARVPEIIADVQRPENSAHVALPSKHAQEIGMQYDRYQRRARADGEKPDDWRVWVDRQHAREIETYHQEWQRLKAVHPDAMPFEEWVHGEQSLRTWAQRHGVLNPAMEQYIERRLNRAAQEQLPSTRYK